MRATYCEGMVSHRIARSVFTRREHHFRAVIPITISVRYSCVSVFYGENRYLAPSYAIWSYERY